MIDEDVDYDLCAISSFTGKYSAVQIILSQYTCKIGFSRDCTKFSALG